MKKKAVVPALALALALALVAVYLVTRDGAGGNSMSLTGNVEVVEVDAGFKTAGRVAELFADEGAQVKKGGALARLESEELAQAVELSRASLMESQERLAELKKGSRRQEIEQAKAALGQAEADLTRAEKEFERARYLFESGAVAEQKLDDARRAMDVAVMARKRAAEALNLVEEGPRKEIVSAADNRVKQAEAALKMAEVRFKDSTLVSPVDGVVTRKHVESGETISGGAAVFTIADLQKPWVRVYVSEERVGQVKLGQKAEVSTDSYPGKKYPGEITYIASEAEFTPKNIQTKEERVKLVFAVKIKVKNDKQELKPGMPADVRLLPNE
ncbi:MAG: efflux RND transporter periplasmic adaptor subunit [Nitrospinae bacterium]|nr:efflux RND transporter periplasmic adaptor subunit [Nitrospinota bacterium]